MPGDLVDPDDIVGVGEIAEMAGVSTAAVANWRARGHGFPEPLFVKKSGTVLQPAGGPAVAQAPARQANPEGSSNGESNRDD